MTQALLEIDWSAIEHRRNARLKRSALLNNLRELAQTIGGLFALFIGLALLSFIASLPLAPEDEPPPQSSTYRSNDTSSFENTDSNQ